MLRGYPRHWGRSNLSTCWKKPPLEGSETNVTLIIWHTTCALQNIFASWNTAKPSNTPRTRHKTSNTNTFRSIPYLQNTETFQHKYIQNLPIPSDPEVILIPRTWFMENPSEPDIPAKTLGKLIPNQVLQKNPNLLSAALPKFAQPSWQAENGTCSYSCLGPISSVWPKFSWPAKGSRRNARTYALNQTCNGAKGWDETVVLVHTSTANLDNIRGLGRQINGLYKQVAVSSQRQHKNIKQTKGPLVHVCMLRVKDSRSAAVVTNAHVQIYGKSLFIGRHTNVVGNRVRLPWPAEKPIPDSHCCSSKTKTQSTSSIMKPGKPQPCCHFKRMVHNCSNHSFHVRDWRARIVFKTQLRVVALTRKCETWMTQCNGGQQVNQVQLLPGCMWFPRKSLNSLGTNHCCPASTTTAMALLPKMQLSVEELRNVRHDCHCKALLRSC